MRYMPVPTGDDDERFFPMAFVSRCFGEDGSNGCQVLIRVFDPALKVWRTITLDQWRFVLEAARSFRSMH